MRARGGCLSVCVDCVYWSSTTQREAERRAAERCAGWLAAIATAAGGQYGNGGLKRAAASLALDGWRGCWGQLSTSLAACTRRVALCKPGCLHGSSRDALRQMFQRYEDEFGDLASEIGQKLKKVEVEPMTRDDAEEALDSVDGLLTELRTVTRSMEMGKRDVPGSERAACERRLQEYQKDLERLNAEARRVRRASAKRQGRQDLLGDDDGISDEARRRSDQTRTLLDVAERGRSSLQRVRCSPLLGVLS